MLEPLFAALTVLGPMVAFQLAARRPGATRRALLGAAALGGAAPVLAWLAGAALQTPEHVGPAMLPYPLLAAMLGAAIGLAGVLARSLGLWLRRRP